MLPFLPASTTTIFSGASEHHGAGGEWRVELPRLRWDILDVWREAAMQYGIAPVDDFNTGDNEGSCYFHVNQKRGRRWSAARGFLKPVLNRQNLRLETGCLVEGLDLRRASARSACAGGRTALRVRARCRGEVILAAGSIGSPHIMMLSGVGPAAQLAQFGIPVVLDKPGVGANLHDHLQLRMIYKVSGIKTLNEMYALAAGSAPGWVLDYALFRRGPMTMAPSQLGAFTKSDATQDRANIQYHVQPLSLDKFGDPLHPFPAFTTSVTNVRPTSRGALTLKSPDPAAAPAIHRIIWRRRRTAASPPIRSASRARSWRSRRCGHMRRSNTCRAHRCASDDEAALVKAAGDIGTTIFHPVGTARMGRADDATRRGRCALARDRHRGLARGRRFGDAVDHVRQHQFADHDDRREGRRHDFARSTALNVTVRITGGVS